MWMGGGHHQTKHQFKLLIFSVFFPPRLISFSLSLTHIFNLLGGSASGTTFYHHCHSSSTQTAGLPLPRFAAKSVHFFPPPAPKHCSPPLSMPRPGPRPYECVRRAWHSDRHQPIRGSLIQEIFRVVNEIHCSATKKNKEWQEKLPVVVLKAEEILYSKANSEAEYMDLKTLWERVNDAINTIIRRDENTETGQFLQPCIEAALNLGCTPRRASRSERNSNPTCYLSSTSQKPPTMPSCIVENTAGEQPNYSPYMSYFSNLSMPNSASPGLNGQTLVSHNHSCFIDKYFTASESVAPSANTQYFSTQNCPASNLVSVFPLYCGNSSHFEEHQNGFNSNSRATDFTCPGKISNRCIADVNTWDDSHRAGTRYAFGSLCNSWCDLSLRLGPPSIPCLNFEDSHPAQVVKEGVMSSRCRRGVKFGDQRHCISPWTNANGPSHPCSEIGSFGDQKVVVEEQRADLSQLLGGKQLHREPKLLFWQ